MAFSEPDRPFAQTTGHVKRTYKRKTSLEWVRRPNQKAEKWHEDDAFDTRQNTSGKVNIEYFIIVDNRKIGIYMYIHGNYMLPLDR